MAKLTTKARGKLSDKDFALPKQRAYPVMDKARARNAKARASQMFKAGKISKDELAMVVKAADDKLYGKGKKKPKKGDTGVTARQIVKRGRNVPPADVESVAARRGDVAKVAAKRAKRSGR